MRANRKQKIKENRKEKSSLFPTTNIVELPKCKDRCLDKKKTTNKKTRLNWR